MRSKSANDALPRESSTFFTNKNLTFSVVELYQGNGFVVCERMNVSVLFIQQNCRFIFFSFRFQRIKKVNKTYTFFHTTKNSLKNRLQTDTNDLK